MDQETLKILRELEGAKLWGTKLFRYGFVLIFSLLLTGTYLFFVNALSNSDMMLLLLHFISGFLFIVPCVMFFLRHKKYQNVFQFQRFVKLGKLLSLCMCLVFFSGVYLFFQGVSGIRWMWISHIVVSLLTCLGLFYYVSLIVKYFKQRLDASGRIYIDKIIKSVSGHVALFTVLFIFGAWTAGWLYQDIDPDKNVPNYSYDLGTKSPFAPSSLKTVSGSFYKEKLFLNSKSCGVSGCHTDTLKQFEDSVHYRTPNTVLSVVENMLIKETKEGKLYSGRGRAAIEELRGQIKGEESFRFCAACHSPVALLSGNITPGEAEPTFEKFEGDSCIFCHVIQKTSYGAGGNLVAPPKRYLFAFSENAVGQYLYKTLVNAKPELHKSTFMKPFYKESSYCIGCHTRLQFPSWQASAYNKQNGHALKEPKECQGCHMQQVPSSDDVSALVKGTIADHRTIAANYVIPILYGLNKQRELTEAFLKDKKLQIETIAPEYIGSNDKFSMATRIANVAVGHNFPAGPESDLIEAWAEIVVKDDKGNKIFEYGATNSDGYLDSKKTKIYRTLPHDVNGTPLETDRHRSWKFAIDEESVIAPRTFDEIAMTVERKNLNGAKKLIIESRLRYRKPNQQFADFLLGKGKLIIPIIDMAIHKSEIIISEQKEELEAAKQKWEKQIKENFVGLRRQNSKDNKVIATKVSMEDQVIIYQALSFYEKNKHKEFLIRLNDISPYAKMRLKNPRSNALDSTEIKRAFNSVKAAFESRGEKIDQYFSSDYK